MTSPTLRAWYPTPATWLPVWVTLEGASAEDPLEEALWRLVDAGVARPHALWQQLCLPRDLIDAAVAALISKGLLREEGAGLAAETREETVSTAQTRPGWMAWDDRSQRPLSQLWLDARLPSPPAALSGWVLHRAPASFARRPHRPRNSHISEALLRTLSAGTLTILEPAGEGVRLVDSLWVSALRLRSDWHPSTHPIWIPVAHRPGGLRIVWRPALRPMAAVSTELDPQGDAGLEDRIESINAEPLQAMERDLNRQLTPQYLIAAGYRSIDDLKDAARRKCHTELRLSSDTWPKTVQMIEAAYVQEALSRLAGLDSRLLAQGWALAVETLTGELARQCVGRVSAHPPAPPERLQRRRLQALLFPGYDRVAGIFSQREDVREQRWAMIQQSCADIRRDRDSIGPRLAVLAVAVLCDSSTRRRIEDADDRFRAELRRPPRTTKADRHGLLCALDQLNKYRNRTDHYRTEAAPVDVLDFSTQVMAVCRALL